MNFRLLMIAKSDINFVIDGISYYEKKLLHLCKLDIIAISNNKKIHDVDEVKKSEGKLIIEKIQPNEYVILLDNNAKTFNSISFAQFIEQKNNQSIKKICFVIGGAYGFSDEVYNISNYKISLSQMTFSHQLVRVIFLEQLYRVLSINKGLPYHHE